MTELQVRFSDQPAPLAAHEQARIQPLIRAIVASSASLRGADTVEIARIAGAPVGLGGQLVVLVKVASGGTAPLPFVLRIGPRVLIADERRRYERFARHLLTTLHAVAGPYAEVGEDAALAYAQLRQPTASGSLRALGQHLEQRAHDDSLAPAIGALFAAGLAPGAERYGWSTTAAAFADQRPLWFYNAVLPPTLTLDNLSFVSRPATPAKLAPAFEAADRPGGQLLGTSLTIALSDELGQIEAVRHPRSGALRLNLFATPVRGRDEFQRPFEPLLARVELRSTPGPDELEGLVCGELALVGRVDQTRYELLGAAAASQAAPAADAIRDGALLHNGQRLANPLRGYARLLGQPLRLTTAVIHGDLNLNNILIAPGAPPQPTVAWLIDFDRTGSGGHAVFDAVKLETEYKLHLLAGRLTVGELIDLELALQQALVLPSRNRIAALLATREQAEAYELIRAIRAPLLAGSEPIVGAHEYDLGLLAYGLAVLKRPVPPAPPDSWRPSSPGLAAYVSASVAASRLREAMISAEESGVALANLKTWPALQPAPDAFPTLRRTAGIVGREEQIQRALACLARATPRVVAISGAPGMQSHLVALELCDRLEGRFALFPGPVAAIAPAHGDDHTASTALANIAALLELLEPILGATFAHREQSLPLAGAVAPETDELERLAARVALALDSALTPWLITLRLERAHTSLLRFVERLWQHTTRTAFVLVTGARLDNSRLPATHQIELQPWGEDELRQLVEQANLPATPAVVAELMRVSGGVPELAERIVVTTSVQSGADPAAVLAALQRRAALTLDAFAVEVMSDWTDEQLWDVGLDALAEEVLGTSWTARLDQLRRLGALNSWSEAGVRRLLAPYQDDLRASIRRRARETAMSYPGAPQRLSELGATLHRLRLVDQLTAARWFAQVNDWERIADLLVPLAEQAGSVAIRSCDILNELAEAAHLKIADHRADALALLAGTSAAYLGKFQQAVNRLSALAASTSDPAVRFGCYARLLPIFRERSDLDGLAWATKRLKEALPADNYYLGLALGYDPSAGPDELRAAIGTLERGAPQWPPGEQSFLAHQLVLLFDRLAEQLYRNGNAEQATATLRRALDRARQLKSETLVARITNNLGLIAFFDYGDAVGARQLLEDARAIREAVGDRVGQLRTIQNLASIMIELAADRVDWDQARALLYDNHQIARQTEAGNSLLLLANLLDLLIRAGDVAAFAPLYRGLPVQVPDPTTDRLLRLNQARSALWAGDSEACSAQLALARARLSADDTVDAAEWLQLRAEGALRGRLPPLDDDARGFAVNALATPVPAPWLHELQLAQGLVALADDQFEAAAAHFERCHGGWTALAYNYKAALALLWRAVAEARLGRLEQAHHSAGTCAERLTSFGPTTPALLLVERLRATAFLELHDV